MRPQPALASTGGRSSPAPRLAQVSQAHMPRFILWGSARQGAEPGHWLLRPDWPRRPAAVEAGPGGRHRCAATCSLPAWEPAGLHFAPEPLAHRPPTSAPDAYAARAPPEQAGSATLRSSTAASRWLALSATACTPTGSSSRSLARSLSVRAALPSRSLAVDRGSRVALCDMAPAASVACGSILLYSALCSPAVAVAVRRSA